MSPRAAEPTAFDPERHRHELIAILDGLEARPDWTVDDVEPLLRRHPKEGRGFFSRSELLAGYRRFARARGYALDEDTFARRIRLRPVRTRSGVTPVTVLTQPFPCPGRCIFCPNDVRMPKSYLADEPGAQRAESHRFDPYLQTWSRLAAYRAIGHPTDKVELIVLGGTWSHHPEPYQVWFVRRCFDALNDFGAGVDGRDAVRPSAPDFRAAEADGAASYNARVAARLRARHRGRLVDGGESASWASLAEAHARNERAATRCVGLSLETRPDCADEAEVLRMRRLGATKVQLGLQSCDDAVLAANRRGHTLEQSRAAVTRLRRAGFKIQAHWMPNLLGATPEGDVEDFARLFSDPALRPDELKVYPCSLVESADLMRHYRDGSWRPYAHDELADVLSACLAATPRWCRITRMIRDISSDDIVVGNKLTNFRQIAERRLAAQGGRARDIRAREIGADAVLPGSLSLRRTGYATAAGREHFLEWVTPEDRIAGFLRLHRPASPSFVPELGARDVVREVHVYGESLALGARQQGPAQHAGLGTRLLEAAARGVGAEGLAVISAVGTRPWYRARGFRPGALYELAPGGRAGARYPAV